MERGDEEVGEDGSTSLGREIQGKEAVVGTLRIGSTESMWDALNALKGVCDGIRHRAIGK